MADDDAADFVPLSLKPGCRLGMNVAPSAKNLGNGLGLTGKQVGHRIRNGFLLRAVRTPMVTNVFILDPPANLLMAGWLSYSNSSYGTANNPVVPVGNRDDFSPPGYAGAGRQLAGGTWQSLGAPGEPPAKDLSEPILSYVHMQPVAVGKYLMLGYMRIPTRLTYSSINTDSYIDLFTDSNTVRVGCAYRLPSAAYRAIDAGSASTLYEAQNSFWVSEGQLPSGWKFLPRRYSIDIVTVSGTKAQPMIGFPCWTFGANVIPATGESGDTDDTFMMATPVVTQLTATWAEPVATGAANYYDLYGQRGLALLTGSLDITAAATGQRYATLTASKVILATDIDQAGLHPLPESIGEGYGVSVGAGDNYGPQRPNWVYFMQPQVARCTDGFVTFCTYWAPYTKAAEGDDSGTPIGTGTGLTTNLVVLYATLCIPPDQSCLAVKGDAWCNSIGAYSAGSLPVIADQNTGYAAVPWTVGAESISTTDEQGNETITAYALVWEEHRDRLQTSQTIVRKDTDQTQPNWRLYFNSWSLGGDWVLYSLESGNTPTRTVLTNSELAPLFAVAMCIDTVFPGKDLPGNSSSGEPAAGYQHPSYASTYYMGNNLLVTAGTDLSLGLVSGCWYPGQTSSGTPLITGNPVTDEHPVYCVTVDVHTGLVAKRGTICTRTDLAYYCHITVVQPETVTSGALAAKPASLVATVFSISPKNRGIENSVAGDTTVYVSSDGGYTWTLYVSDTAAPNGAFLIGNQLWNNDVTSRYDEGLAG